MRDSVRKLVARRAGGLCEYCGWPDWFTPGPFAVEHVLPLVRGGSDDPENLAYACSGCNNAKYDAVEATYPSTGALAPLFHPRRDRWSDHFTWSDDGLIQIGQTPTGRATVQRLRLNRPEVRLMRRMVRLFPPNETDA